MSAEEGEACYAVSTGQHVVSSVGQQDYSACYHMRALLVLFMFNLNLRSIVVVSCCRATAATPHASRTVLWTTG